MRITVSIDDRFTDVLMERNGPEGPARAQERLPPGGPGPEVIFAQERKFPIIPALAVDVKTGRRNDVYAGTNGGEVEPERIPDAPIEGINFNGEAGGQANFDGWSDDIGARFIAVFIRIQERNAAFHTNRHKLRRSNLVCCDRNQQEQDFVHVRLRGTFHAILTLLNLLMFEGRERECGARV